MPRGDFCRWTSASAPLPPYPRLPKSSAASLPQAHSHAASQWTARLRSASSIASHGGTVPGRDFRSRRGLPKPLRTLSAAPFPLPPLRTPGLSPSHLSRGCRAARSPIPCSRRSPLPRAPENKQGEPAALLKAARTGTGARRGFLVSPLGALGEFGAGGEVYTGKAIVGP